MRSAFVYSEKVQRLFLFLFGWCEGWANSLVHKLSCMCDGCMVDTMLETKKQGDRVVGVEISRLKGIRVWGGRMRMGKALHGPGREDSNSIESFVHTTGTWHEWCFCFVF